MTQILCRIDSANRPVVFIADSLSNGQIKAWQDGEQKIKKVGIDYYQSTQPLSESDSKIMAEKFAKTMRDDHVLVRRRLPKVYRTVPNVLAPAAVEPEQTKSDARKEAAKRRYEQELAQTAAHAEGLTTITVPADERELFEMALKIVRALKAGA